jgi:hypothetical protein
VTTRRSASLTVEDRMPAARGLPGRGVTTRRIAGRDLAQGHQAPGVTTRRSVGRDLAPGHRARGLPGSGARMRRSASLAGADQRVTISKVACRGVSPDPASNGRPAADRRARPASASPAAGPTTRRALAPESHASHDGADQPHH